MTLGICCAIFAFSLSFLPVLAAIIADLPALIVACVMACVTLCSDATFISYLCF